MRTPEELVRLSPVPVIFLANNKMDSNDLHNYETACFKYTSKAFPGYKIIDWFLKRPRIEIRDGLDDPWKIYLLLHEIGHAKCYKKNCECFQNPNRIYREIHADEYALSGLLNNGVRKALRVALWHIKGVLENNQHNYHGEAARYIMKSELWRSCENKIIHWERNEK